MPFRLQYIRLAFLAYGQTRKLIDDHQKNFIYVSNKIWSFRVRTIYEKYDIVTIFNEL